MTQCETCCFYNYDEEYDEYICDVDLDEDEMVRFLSGRGGLPLLAARRRIPHRPAAIGGNMGGFFHRPVIQWPCRIRGAKGE